jgi:hypothetical protein
MPVLIMTEFAVFKFYVRSYCASLHQKGQDPFNFTILVGTAEEKFV